MSTSHPEFPVSSTAVDRQVRERRHRLIVERCGHVSAFSLGTPHLITFINPYSYGRLLDHPEDVISGFDHIHPDGISLALCLRVILRKPIARQSFDFTSVAAEVFSSAENLGLRIACVGGTATDVAAACTAWRLRHPSLSIVYARDGFFATPKDREDCIRDIKHAQPHIVIVGMGTPAQEHFALACRDAGVHATIYTCGGFISQSAKNANLTEYYPKIVNLLHLRFAWRIYKEPHTRRRYLLDYPRCLVIFLILSFSAIYE